MKSKSAHAGVVFPVGRIRRHFKAITPHFRLSMGAPVFMAAALEYVSAEVLHVAGDFARSRKRVRIKPRDIRLGVGSDKELSKLCQDVTFSDGGSMINIHAELLPKNSKSLGKTLKRPASASNVKKHAKKPMQRIPKKTRAAPSSTSGTGPSAVAATPSATATTSSASNNVTSALNAPAATLPVLSEGTLFLGQKLIVLMGDISLVDSEAIVHPTNNTYSTAGQVGQVLLRAGGPQYNQALENLKTEGSLAKSGVSICDMSQVKAKKIIHCNCPAWSKSQDVVDLHKTVENCLKLADKEHLKSIALPSVGSGNAGWPKQLAAETILRSIDRYFQTIMASSIKHVYFVLYDKESVDIYTSELNKLLDGGSY